MSGYVGESSLLRESRVKLAIILGLSFSTKRNNVVGYPLFEVRFEISFLLLSLPYVVVVILTKVIVAVTD